VRVPIPDDPEVVAVTEVSRGVELLPVADNTDRAAAAPDVVFVRVIVAVPPTKAVVRTE
jgi:hypothetical protein